MHIFSSMKHLFIFVTAIGLLSASTQAEPVEDLKNDLRARRKVVNEWFKAELIKIARQAKTDEERQKVLTACEWEWDAGKAGVTWITLSADGRGIHHHQGSSFAWTIEGWMLKLVFPSGVMTLKFDPDTLSFTGKDSRKNTIKGSPKLES